MTSAMCDTDNQNVESAVESLYMARIRKEDVDNLLVYFSKNTYGAKAADDEANSILQRCINLMKLDYCLSIIDNSNGELCSHYPSQLPILEYEKASHQNINIGSSGQSAQRTTNTIYENTHDVKNFRDIINRAKIARCRSRFPIPTILYKGKYICRSSTLSGGPEIYGRSGLDYLFYGSVDTASKLKSEEDMDTNSETSSCSTPSEWQLFDKVRSQDIKLLKKLHVGTIVDLMVEKKKVKFGLNVTSSEKVDKENRYSDFNIMSLPYPGCEFFKAFKEYGYCADGLVFDWSQDQCDAPISVPDNPLLTHLKIEWNNYKQWDLVQMTQNYTKYLLKYLQDNSSGMLIHCISGWDRTPLFISLLRLSLWADGLVHQSLDAYQMLYLTIAYDWLLFGHHLSNRLDKGEEIFCFCFAILKYIASDEFSVAPGRHKIKKISEKVAEDNRIDSDSQPELLLEQDLRGSNISLNSTCSTVSSKSQDHHDESNGNLTNSGYSLDVRDTMPLGASTSPQARRTSPVTVPVGTRLKRTESSTTTSSVHSTHSTHSTHSSNSAGSWQVVTGTGSLKSSDSTSSSDIAFSHTSMCTIIDGDEWPQESSVFVPCRQDRLLAIRNLFYSSYFGTVGSKNIQYVSSESPLFALIGNLAGKVVDAVGLTQRT